jgi:phospho-N-acetylmuramoyl-pentapeptide-transferase
MISLILGFVTAFLLAALPGKAVIARLRQLGAQQNISTDAPTAHTAKQGTPTMGGLLILFALTVTVLAYFLLTQLGAHRHVAEDYTLPALLALTLAYGVIGFADDYLSFRRGKNLGLKAREKFAAQCGVAFAFLFWVAATAHPNLTTVVTLSPSLVTNALARPELSVDPGWGYYLVAFLFIVGLSNATNITDGLDGLSSGLTILICLALAALVSVMYPALSFFAVALAGGLAGFLWWNAHPARVFMGDTCSLALGAGLAGVAILGKQEIGLIVASLVCWAELISVIIQVSVFKYRRRKYGLEYAKAHRVFRRTPLHHHFEEAGWPETQVVLRLWLVGALCAALALLWERG